MHLVNAIMKSSKEIKRRKLILRKTFGTGSSSVSILEVSINSKKKKREKTEIVKRTFL